MFKKIEFFEGKKVKGWKPFLNELGKDNATGILLLVAEEIKFDYEKIQPLLKKMKIPVWGGIFPEVIYNGSRFKQGVVGCSFKSSVSLEVIKNLNDFKGALPETLISKNTETLFILNDGWANNIPLLIETLYEISGKEMTFIGGGSGSLIDMKRPSLFTSDDYFAGGAIIASIEDYISIGVNHGWQTIYGPATASSVKKHILKSINWEPAFKYYKKIVEKDAGVKLTKDNFLEIAKSYPLGMLKYDNEIILRVPIEFDAENNILLSSEIPENSILMIMKGSPEKLIAAAGLATSQARNAFESKKKTSSTKALIIDCITRALFLEDRFEDELKIIENKAGTGVLLFGFLSLGEIASTGDKYIELYNKTVVISLG